MSSITVCTCLCSLLIATLCCQLTKCLSVFLSTRKESVPWLRSVSLVSLLGAVTFSSILPLWTAAAALSHIRSQELVPYHKDQGPRPYISTLKDDSPVFITFTATIAIIVTFVFVLYYKAALNLKEYRIQLESSQLFLLEYR